MQISLSVALNKNVTIYYLEKNAEKAEQSTSSTKHRQQNTYSKKKKTQNRRKEKSQKK